VGIRLNVPVCLLVDAYTPSIAGKSRRKFASRLNFYEQKEVKFCIPQSLAAHGEFGAERLAGVGRAWQTAFH